MSLLPSPTGDWVSPHWRPPPLAARAASGCARAVPQCCHSAGDQTAPARRGGVMAGLLGGLQPGHGGIPGPCRRWTAPPISWLLGGPPLNLLRVTRTESRSAGPPGGTQTRRSDSPRACRGAVGRPAAHGSSLDTIRVGVSEEAGRPYGALPPELGCCDSDAGRPAARATAPAAGPSKGSGPTDWARGVGRRLSSS